MILTSYLKRRAWPHALCVLSLYSTCAVAQVPAAYIAPKSLDDTGLTTIIDYQKNLTFPYTLKPHDNGYNHDWSHTFSTTTNARGRVTIRQYPKDTTNNFPVEITVGGPNSYDVGSIYTNVGPLQGPSGFDSRPLYVGTWISNASFDIRYAGSAPNATSFLAYSYPETQANSGTQSYTNAQTISLSMSANLSPDPGKSGVGGSVGYSESKVVGGTVQTKQMNVVRSNSGVAGNKWVYTTQLDNTGHNITQPYEIWQNGSDVNTVKNAIPDIAKNFTPKLGQFWRIPKGQEQKFKLYFDLTQVASWGIESWVWGVWLAPSGNRSESVGLTYAVYDNPTLTLDSTHPAISGLNTYRFRYANNGKCLVQAVSSQLPTLMKMQDCNSQVADQYFIQNSDSTINNPGWTFNDPNANLGTTNAWIATFGSPMRYRDGNVECASYDGHGCLWGTAASSLVEANLKPLVCGDMHKRLYGISGYDTPNHWCSQAQAVLRPTAKWFTDDTIYGGAQLAVIGGNIACYAPGGMSCGSSTTSAPTAVSKANLLVCGKDHASKYGSSGYQTGHWCSRAAALYLPPSIEGESGDLYSMFYFKDNGTIMTSNGNFRVDYVNGKSSPLVRDINIGSTRDGLWQYLMF